MTVQQSVSALAGVFMKALRRTKSDKVQDPWAASGLPERNFPKVTTCSHLFYTDRHSAFTQAPDIPRNNSLEIIQRDLNPWEIPIPN